MESRTGYVRYTDTLPIGIVMRASSTKLIVRLFPFLKWTRPTRLRRISYAVFCLKKKKKTNKQTTNTNKKEKKKRI